MDREINRPIIVTSGSWKHIHLVCVHHQHYPEIRGEGRSLGAAIRQLTSQLTRCLESARGPEGREAISQALEDLQDFRASVRPRKKLAGSRT